MKTPVKAGQVRALKDGGTHYFYYMTLYRLPESPHIWKLLALTKGITLKRGQQFTWAETAISGDELISIKRK